MTSKSITQLKQARTSHRKWRNKRMAITAVGHRVIGNESIVVLLAIVVVASVLSSAAQAISTARHSAAGPASGSMQSTAYKHPQQGNSVQQQLAASQRRTSPSPNINNIDGLRSMSAHYQTQPQPQLQLPHHMGSSGEQVAEGLTLAPPSGSNNGPGTGSLGGNNASREEWPLNQLDKIKSESRLVAVAGQNVVLNCAVQFKDGIEKPFVVNWLKYPSKLPIYMWYAGYPPYVTAQYENRVSRIGQASLNLSQVREQDQGLYECKIYHLHRQPDDKGTSTWIFLDVQAPPRFTRTPPPVNYVQSGDSLHLTCAAQSSPAPLVRWYKDKTPITSDTGAYRLSSATLPASSFDRTNFGSSASNASSHASSNSTPDTTTHSPERNEQNNTANSKAISATAAQLGAPVVSQLDLFIDNVQAGQATGDYSCLASNSEGSIGAKTQVLVAVPAVIVTVPKNQTRQEGDRVEMYCQAKAIPSNITYRWLFNNKLISGLKWFESRYTIKRDGTLVLYAIHRDDEGDYKCQATNGIAHRDRQSAVVVAGPSWSQVSSGVAGEVSSSADQPPASPGAPGDESPYTTSTTESLNAHDQDKNHYGRHKQQPVPTTAPIYAEASAHLTVEYPARIVHSPQVQYLPLGLSGVIRCYVAAAPPVEFFTWTMNNQQFDPNIDPNVERMRNGSLLIHQVSERYEGKYRCTPFNKHGSAGSSGPMEVIVERPPQFELKPAEFYKANLNGRVEIPCSASGSPTPTVTWRRVVQHPAGTGRHANVGVVATAYDQHRRRSSSKEHEQEARDLSVHDQSQADESSVQNDERSPVNNNNAPGSSGTMDQQSSVMNGNGDSNSNDNIEYVKLPSDRSEFRNDHLLMHSLRKEDHGKYECVVENEIATLVASTQLYIEETTPHVPLDVRVETRAWSAKVSWQPGYDGGFEQSFVVWYRQVDESSSTSARTAASKRKHTPPDDSNNHHALDLNWHSVSVPLGQPNEIVVENLTQDTTYEFYVRAKNIIGDGPRTQIIQATTKRAISPSGSLAPNEALDPLASTVLTADQSGPATPSYVGGGGSGGDDEENEQPSGTMSTLNPNVLAIIHLKDVTTSTTAPVTEAPQQPADAGRADLAQQQQQQNESSSADSSKEIKVYIPKKHTASNNASSPNKREDDSRRNQMLQRESEGMSLLTAVVDNSTAPRNVSMVRVAQGWVLSWEPPERAPHDLPAPLATGELAASGQAARSSPSSSESPQTMMQQQQQQQQQQQLQQQLQQLQQQQQTPSAVTYVAEFSEKVSPANWTLLASTSGHERSLLVKDLKPGGEYSFRVSAQSSLTGARGSPSAEFKYQVADNRRKPGSTQALSAGVVSGVLFFIACIVIAVCGVNMCNKRRKKRAEKAAYVMMACPVLESHTDIAALNSNSLVKNRGERSAQDRVPGLIGRLQKALSDLAPSRPAGQRRDRASRADGSLFANRTMRTLRVSAPMDDNAADGPSSARRRNNGTNNHTETDWRPGAADEPTTISYSTNEPVPIDVAGICSSTEITSGGRAADSTDGDGNLGPASSCDEMSSRRRQQQQQLDHYWRRQPSDRKWGTLTLAGSKLCERLARERSRSTGLGPPRRQSADERAPEVASSHVQQSGAGPFGRLCRSADGRPLRPMTSRSMRVGGGHCRSYPKRVRPPDPRPTDPTATAITATSETLPRSFWSNARQQFVGAAAPLASMQPAAAKTPNRPSRLDGSQLDQQQQQQQQQHRLRLDLGAESRLRFAHQQFSDWLDAQRQQRAAACLDGAPTSGHGLPNAATGPLAAPAHRLTTNNTPMPAELAPAEHIDRRPTTAANGDPGADQPDQLRLRFGPDRNHHQSFTGVSSAAVAAIRTDRCRRAYRTDCGTDAAASESTAAAELTAPTATTTMTALLAAQQQQCRHANNSISLAPHHRRSISQIESTTGGCRYWLPTQLPLQQIRPPPATPSNQADSDTNANCLAATTQPEVNLSFFLQRQRGPVNSLDNDNIDSTTMSNGLHISNRGPPPAPIKRNSYGRSTLPMAAPIAANANGCFASPTQTALIQSNGLLANDMHSLQHGLYCDAQYSAHVQCPNVPMYPVLWPLCPTQTPPQLSRVAPPGDGGQVDRQFLADDDPVTDNACLGSYKRRKRLPHIEAQFTMAPVRQSDTKAPSNASSGAGGLFVRELHSSSQDPVPRGMPQPGQRRLAALESPAISGLAQVRPIGAREKIETYLRHYELQQEHPTALKSSPRRAPPPPPPPPLPPPQARTLSRDVLGDVSARHQPPVELDQVDELTFQPYYNLPSLKYTIQLPLRRTPSGRLLLDETSHLHCVQSSRRKRGYSLGDESADAAATSEPERGDSCRRQSRALRLGSSSSCPAPSSEFGEMSTSVGGSGEDPLAECEDLGDRGKPLGAADRSSSTRHSLGSSMDHPTIANRPRALADAHAQADSLEDTSSGGMDRDLSEHRRRQEDTPVGEYTSVAELGWNESSRPATADERVTAEPPPVPPHRRSTSTSSSAATLTNDAATSSGAAVADEGARQMTDAASSTLASSSTATSSTSNPAPSESPTSNDHSVDENYEFDQMSSCSSSHNNAAANKHQVMRGRNNGANEIRQTDSSHQQQSQVQVDGNGDNMYLYSQVDKTKRRRQRQQQKEINDVTRQTGNVPVAIQSKMCIKVGLVRERSHFYDFSRQKQQPLVSPPPDTNNYDTVYETNSMRTDNSKEN